MPFKSEAQRRFLWATQKKDKAGNVIARKWAHEKGTKNKGLPMYTKKKEAKVQLAKSLAKALGKNKKLLTRKNFDSAMFATGALTGVGSLGMMLNNQRKQKQMQKTAARGQIGSEFLKLIGQGKLARKWRKGAVKHGDAISKVLQKDVPGLGWMDYLHSKGPQFGKWGLIGQDPKKMADWAVHKPAIAGVAGAPAPGTSVVAVPIGKRIDGWVLNALRAANKRKGHKRQIARWKAELETP